MSRGVWIQTRSGIPFYPQDPRPEDICVEDIAHALGNLCRFSGHVKRYYSVAEHSVLVSRLVPPRFALAALLHDASEAYLVDIPKPIKPLLPVYERMEANVMKQVHKHFGIHTDLVSERVERDTHIHYADMAMLLTEKNQLMGEGRIPWDPSFAAGIEPAQIGELECLAPREAKHAFLERFKELS